jgi:hypothetical protein
MNLIDIDDNNYNSVVELTDIGLVSSAVINQFEILSINRDPKYAPRVSFLFKKTKKLEELIEKYFKGELLVDSKTFLTTLRDIKSRTKISY